MGTTTNLGKFLQDWTLIENGAGEAPINPVTTSQYQLTVAETAVNKVYTAFGMPTQTFSSNTSFVPIAAFSATGTETEIYFFHPDHLGSSNYITNFVGELTQHSEYFAFGETFIEEHKNSHNSPYKFNGKELDEETGLYYYGARYYDPRISIWASVDPLVEQTMSAYGYCNLNPVNLIDPTGMSSEDPDDPGKKSWFGRAWDTVKGWFGGSEKSEKKCQVTVGPIQEVSNNKENIQKGQQIVLNVLAAINGGSGKFDEAVSSAAEETKNVNTSVRWTSIAGSALMAEKFDTAGMLGSSIQYGWGNSLNKTANAAKGGFSINSSKFDYFFGRVVSGTEHNIARSAQNLKDLTTLGIKSESQLMNVFGQALESGTVISTKTSQYGTTVMRSINIGKQGSINVGFFYQGGNMSVKPSVSTIIPKIFK